MNFNIVGNIKEVVHNWFPLNEESQVNITENEDTENYIYTFTQGELGSVPYLEENINIPKINVIKLETAEEGYFATYKVTEAGTEVGVSINIPKDFLVKSASVEVCTVDDEPVEGYAVGDKYLDFVVNTKDGSGSDEHLYILVTELVDVYSSDNSTLELSSGNVFSVKDGGITLVKLNSEVTSVLNSKVDKVTGKGLSTEDFTTNEKSKLASLENYDDTDVKSDIFDLETNKQDVLVNKSTLTFVLSDGTTETHTFYEEV